MIAIVKIVVLYSKQKTHLSEMKKYVKIVTTAACHMKKQQYSEIESGRKIC